MRYRTPGGAVVTVTGGLRPRYSCTGCEAITYGPRKSVDQAALTHAVACRAIPAPDRPLPINRGTGRTGR
jgi:hypothetical protein